MSDYHGNNSYNDSPFAPSLHIKYLARSPGSSYIMRQAVTNSYIFMFPCFSKHLRFLRFLRFHNKVSRYIAENSIVHFLKHIPWVMLHFASSTLTYSCIFYVSYLLRYLRFLLDQVSGILSDVGVGSGIFLT